MTFTKEQLDKMVWDADIAHRSIIGESVLADVCCHVKALATEVDRLRAIIDELYRTCGDEMSDLAHGPSETYCNLWARIEDATEKARTP